MKIKYTDLVIQASRDFLCEELPEDYNEMSQLKLAEFLEDYAWEPLENWDVWDVWECIENSAASWAVFLELRGVTVDRGKV